MLEWMKNNIEKYKDRKSTKEQKKDNIKRWCSIYRRNPSLYLSRHLQIKLHPFQHIMLHLMGISEVFFAICSRGLSKTFLCGAYCFYKCLLFPYSEVHLTSSTISQATKMVKEKMEGELCKKLSPILKYYYEQGLIEFHYGDEVYVDFTKLNGSKLWVDACADSSRGGRATLLVYEECRLIKKTMIDSVFEKMAHPRQAIFLNNPKYTGNKRWVEECQSVYITSARYKAEWFWRMFKTVVEECYNNRYTEYNFFAADIFVSIEFGLKTISDYFKARKNSAEIEMRMEDLNEMIGEAEDAFFKLDDFKKNQISKIAYRFPTTQQIETNEDLKNRQKQDNEIRLLWIDFAFANTTGAEENDQSVIGCTSIINKNDKWIRLSDYITTHPASDSDGIDLKIREMFWDYHADYIVFDCRNGGEVMYNDLTKPRIHPYRSSDKWNEHGFTISSDSKFQTCTKAKLDDLKSRTVDPQAIPCLIPMIGTPELNNNMWIDLQKQLRDETVELLIEDINFDQEFSETSEYWSMNSEEKMEIMKPYIMTEALIGEAINLSQEWREGKVRLTEPRTGTKDIIVSYAYGNYVSSLIINDKEKDTEPEWTISDWAFLAG